MDQQIDSLGLIHVPKPGVAEGKGMLKSAFCQIDIDSVQGSVVECDGYFELNHVPLFITARVPRLIPRYR
jgi:hypothetical protein